MTATPPPTPPPGSSPTWYDVLGVPAHATSEEIKTAWRHATDKFEPGSGSGQFRMFNEAADVLLDPERRRAYDASLASATAPVEKADEPAGPPPAAPVEVPGPADSSDEAPSEAPSEPPAAVATGRKSRLRPLRRRRSAASSSAGAGTVAKPASRAAVVVAAVLALLTVAALAFAGWFALQVREDAQVADTRDEAPAAAERAAKAILSYDYKQLAADRKRAKVYLTEDYAEEYEKTFSLLEKQKDGAPGAAVQTKTTVSATVLGSGVMDAEKDKARVLVFVNQVSKRPDREPQIFQNRVAMTMEKSGNRWLVADLKSY